MIYVAALASGLMAAVVISWLADDADIVRGALALLLNWSILTGYALLTGNQYEELINMSVDWATIWIGFAPAKRFPQVLMAVLFGTGFLLHADHLFKLWMGIPLEQLKSPFWWRFYYLSWAQVALVIGWGGYGWRRLFIARNAGGVRRVSPVCGELDLAHLPMGEP